MANYFKRPRKFVFILIVLAGILTMVSGSWSCTEKMQSTTIGMVDDISNTLIYTAEEKSFFTANGLNVTLKRYDTGVAARDAMIKGEVDIAAATEFVIVGKAFQKEKISIIVTKDRSQSIYLIAWKNRGVEKILDLKGRRVGLARGTIVEFYLGRFLQFNSMNIQDVTLVDLKPAQFISAITSGDIDAIIVWQPFVHQILGKEGGEVVAWPANNSQPAYDVLMSSNEWLTQHTDTVERFLKSLAEAEDYLIHHPAEIKSMVGRWLNYDDSYIESIWLQHQFSLSLDFSLLAAMNDEARWMISNNLTGEKTIPNFKEYLYLDGLKAVKPAAVGIIQ